MKDYSKIINHEHHQSKTRPHMSMMDRAAQFSAFDALNGLAEALSEAQDNYSDNISYEAEYIEDLESGFP